MNHNAMIEQTLRLGPVIPVLVIDDLEQAVPLARALVAGGLKVLEITLRTHDALEVIELVASSVPEAVVVAGTVTRPGQLRAAREAGAQMGVSPGLTPALAEASQGPGTLPLLPGVATATELMLGIEAGFASFKLFPAEAAGGLALLKSLHGPFPHALFCPTGGITLESAPRYLAMSNVACVGGSWLAPKELVAQGRWDQIEALARAAAALSHG
jgi:2-dehydro-3-deoxyphosphogluconate aldolase/(4S)-4-hydroxy-2-oxoglutarate aldolase